MCITKEKLMDAYSKGSPRERFTLIYKNYEVFPKLMNSYEIGLFNQILFEVEYNRRSRNEDDLGVRIQTSHKSDPTAATAIRHVLIREAIEDGNFSGNILKETDNPEKHRQDIITLHMMRREYEVFDTGLRALSGREFRITYAYIHKDQTVSQIAEDEDRADQSIRNLLAATRKTLEQRIVPFFRESL